MHLVYSITLETTLCLNTKYSKTNFSIYPLALHNLDYILTCNMVNNIILDSGGGCFPSIAKLKLVNGKSIMMSDIQIGDKIQTGMETVCFFISE